MTRKQTLLVGSLGLGCVCTTALLAATGGPDAGGYTYTDSDESSGPTYVTLELDGTVLGLGDEDTATVDLPFEFNFYGSDEQTVTVGDNGTLFFSGSQDPVNSICPATSGSWSGIAAYWTDLEVDTVQYQTVGQYPYRLFVVDWSGIHPDGITGEGRVQTWLRALRH